MQRLSKEALEVVGRFIPAGVVVIEKENDKIIYVNQRIVELFGFDPYGLSFKEYVINMAKIRHLENDPCLYDQLPLIKALRYGQTTCNQEITIQRPNQTQLTLSANATPLTDEKGNITGAMVIFEDITERKIAQEQLSFQSKILDLVGQSVIVTDIFGKIIYWSKAAQDMFGWQQSEAIGRNVVEVTIPQMSQKDAQQIMAQLAKGEHWQGEYKVKRKDGTEFYILAHDTPMLNDKGELVAIVGVSTDITERKKAEITVKENEQLYRTLFDNSQDGFQLAELIYDKDKKPIDERVLKVNKAYEEQTGFRATDVVGKRKTEYLPKIEPHQFEVHDQVLKTGKTIHTETYIQDAKRYFDCYVFPYSKNVVGLLFKDITERKKAEQTLDKTQQELNCILDSSPTIIFYKDKEGKFIQANKAFGEALKVPKEKLLGKTVFDLYSENIAQSMTNDDFIVLESKCPKLDIIEPYESPTGIKWIRTHKIPSLDENGNVTGLIGFSEEITERKQAEEALKESQAKYEQLVNRLPEMIFEIDTHGRVTFANLRAIDLLGYSKAELEGNFDANRLVAAEDVKYSLENMKKMFASGKRQSSEYVFVKKDGTRFPVLLNSAPIMRDSRIVGVRGIAVDITEFKNMEKQLQEKERLAAIGQTVGMVGHDIRNPLQAMMSDIYLLKNYLLSMPQCQMKTDVTESLEGLEKNITYVNKIVADLQDYTRAITPRCIEVNLYGLVEEVFQTIAIPNDVEVSIDILPSLELKIDSVLAKRILSNLIINAIQAMFNGGKLEISANQTDSKVVICVSDTGVGIPEEVRAKLFTPLMTTKAQGQGLGLAVVKRLVTSLNGTISFESEVGKGTKFIVSLPIK